MRSVRGTAAMLREADDPPNIALQLTGTALHLSPVKSLARLHRRSKAAPAAERNVRSSTRPSYNSGIPARRRRTSTPPQSPLVPTGIHTAGACRPGQLHYFAAELAVHLRRRQRAIANDQHGHEKPRGDQSLLKRRPTAGPDSVLRRGWAVDHVSLITASWSSSKRAVSHASDVGCPLVVGRRTPTRGGSTPLPSTTERDRYRSQPTETT